MMPLVQFWLINIFSWFLQMIPEPIAVSIGQCCGGLMYAIDSKHRELVYQNVKEVFCSEKSLDEIQHLTWCYFLNLGANFVEFLRLPAMDARSIEKYIRIDGLDHLQAAMNRGKGAVLMTMHFGNWELPMLALGPLDYSVNLIFKSQRKSSEFNRLMIGKRKKAFQRFPRVKFFERGQGARTLWKALKGNEVIGMLIDQGGKDGIPVKFFGRMARFSDGGMRLALMTGAAVCIGGIIRERGAYHRLVIYPFDLLSQSGYAQEDGPAPLQMAVDVFEKMIRQYPEQYMWMYKIWKFDTSVNIMILDDGRVGHIRQSQAVARVIGDEARSRNGEAHEHYVPIHYRNSASKYMILFFAFIRPIIPRRIALWVLRAGVSEQTFEKLSRRKADVVVSAGSVCGPVNYLIAREHQAKAVTLLRPSVIPLSRFHAVIAPQHDMRPNAPVRRGLIVTKGAPNLIDDRYLKEHASVLMQRYSHLKLRNKFMIGVLLGGDTKSYILDESVVRILCNQIKEAAEQLDADIMITTSRRTSEKVENLVMREFKKYARSQLLIIANRNNMGEAVGGILALSDVLVVSGDSISMVSEAASSGKKTVVFSVNRRAGAVDDHKHNRFVSQMNQDGYILSSDPALVGQAIFNLAKNKITTRTLDDMETIRRGMRTCVL